MLGKRNPQRGLFGTVHQLGPEVIKQMGFYGVMAREGHRLFKDEDFAEAYCPDNGRRSCPPSLLAVARLLQHYAGISDAEVVERCRFDLRWKFALDLDLAALVAPFAKSTFQAFRLRLTLHAKEGLAFERSVKVAQAAGLLPQRLRVALDSSPVRGRGAVKDTFNLLSDAIAHVVRAVAAKREMSAADVACEAKLERHIECDSIKGSEIVDWDNQGAVSTFLGGLLEDSERAIAIAEQANCGGDEVELLRKVVDQDVERAPTDGTPRIKQGVEPDRTVSAHDPEMRHGRKSSGKVYNGHKAHVAVDTGSQVILGVTMTAPAEADGAQVQSLLQKAHETTGLPIDQALADTAYSSREAIAQACEENVEIVTKMRSPPAGRLGPEDFEVSEDGSSAVCPGGKAPDVASHGSTGHQYIWNAKTCADCPLASACKRPKAKTRSLVVPPDFHERRQRERYAASKEGRTLLRQRVVVEHVIGRLKNLGAGASRYFGRDGTLSQWLWSAAVVNLQLAWK
jgi:hypothetical protein